MVTKTQRHSPSVGKLVSSSSAAHVHIVRLTDPAPAKAIAKLKARVRTEPGFAKGWLLKNGFITPGGKLPKRLGG